MPSYLKAADKDIDSMFEKTIEDGTNPLEWKYNDPAQFMKHMDTSFESFFY